MFIALLRRGLTSRRVLFEMCLLTESMPLKYANELSEKMFNWVFYFREKEGG